MIIRITPPASLIYDNKNLNGFSAYFQAINSIFHGMGKRPPIIKGDKIRRGDDEHNFAFAYDGITVIQQEEAGEEMTWYLCAVSHEMRAVIETLYKMAPLGDRVKEVPGWPSIPDLSDVVRDQQAIHRSPVYYRFDNDEGEAYMLAISVYGTPETGYIAGAEEYYCPWHLLHEWEWHTTHYETGLCDTIEEAETIAHRWLQVGRFGIGWQTEMDGLLTLAPRIEAGHMGDDGTYTWIPVTGDDLGILCWQAGAHLQITQGSVARRLLRGERLFISETDMIRFRDAETRR